eukprot:3053946-Pleurochrysis_carterae.AAC.1
MDELKAVRFVGGARRDREEIVTRSRRDRAEISSRLREWDAMHCCDMWKGKQRSCVGYEGQGRRCGSHGPWGLC